MISRTVVIVGGGFSGTLVAAHLLRQRRARLRVTLVERRLPPTHGVAYSTHSPGHLLNVRAKGMSALPDDPDHFLNWARGYVPGLTGEEFLPRSLYGEYLYSILVDATVRESGRYVGSPWDYERLRSVGRDDTVLLLGTGLTMVDSLVSLGDAGHVGPIQAVSRRGFLPLVHETSGGMARDVAEWVASDSARVLVSRVRALAAHAEHARLGWRAAIDALRPITSDLWRGLPERERARFLRHAVRFWEVHRHRVAPEVDALVASLVGSGRLTVRAGRVERAALRPDGLEVDLLERRTRRRETLPVQWVVNCTGPSCDFRAIEDPFVADLRDLGIVVPDPLGLGIEVTEAGAVLSASGRPSDAFYAVGPLRKGRLWESTAVPELRRQATDLAEEIASAPEPRGEVRAAGRRPRF